MNEKKRTFTDRNETDKEFVKKFRNIGYGSIKNLTRQRLTLPKNLEKKYCVHFLDAGRTCKFGKSCRFEHAAYPSGFTPNDKAIMEKHIQETNGLSVVKDKKVSQE